MSDDKKEVCKNGCDDCGCGGVKTAQSEQTSEGNIAPGISTVNEPMSALNVVKVTRDENGGITLEIGNEAPVCDENEFLDAAGNKHYGKPPVTLTQNADGSIAVDCGGATADEVAEAIAGALEQSGIDPETAYPMGASDETEATAAMVFGLPQITTNSELVSVVNAIQADKLAAAVGDMITAAKETVRIAPIDLSYTADDELLLHRVIKSLSADAEGNPQLRPIIKILESWKGSLVGEATAYRDAHARVMTQNWQVMLADVGDLSTLMLRAKIDANIVGNYNDNAWMQWWEENIRPWCIKYGYFFALPGDVGEADWEHAAKMKIVPPHSDLRGK